MLSSFLNDRNIGAAFMTTMGMASWPAPTRRRTQCKLSKGIPFFQRVTFRIIKRMGSGAEAHNRFPGFQIVINVFYLLGRQSSPPKKEDREVCILQRFQPGNVFFGGMVRRGFKDLYLHSVALF